MNIVTTVTGINSVTIPSSVVAGDILLAFCFRDGTATAPGLISGFTNIRNSTTTSCAARAQYRHASSSLAGTTITSTNATATILVVIREAALASVTSTAGSGTGSTTTYPALTASAVSGTNNNSVFRFAGHRTQTAALDASSGFSRVTSYADGVNIAVCDYATNKYGSIASGSDPTGAASGWIAYTIELVEVAAGSSYTVSNTETNKMIIDTSGTASTALDTLAVGYNGSVYSSIGWTFDNITIPANKVIKSAKLVLKESTSTSGGTNYAKFYASKIPEGFTSVPDFSSTNLPSNMLCDPYTSTITPTGTLGFTTVDVTEHVKYVNDMKGGYTASNKTFSMQFVTKNENTDGTFTIYANGSGSLWTAALYIDTGDFTPFNVVDVNIIPVGTTSFTIPYNMSSANVYCVGSGGNGANGSSTMAGGAGGGGGIAANFFQSFTKDVVFNCYVDAAGGQNGTWFDTETTLYAESGKNANGIFGGLGGQALYGSSSYYSGGAGGNGRYSNTGAGGGGGGSVGFITNSQGGGGRNGGNSGLGLGAGLREPSTGDYYNRWDYSTNDQPPYYFWRTYPQNQSMNIGWNLSNSFNYGEVVRGSSNRSFVDYNGYRYYKTNVLKYSFYDYYYPIYRTSIDKDSVTGLTIQEPLNPEFYASSSVEYNSGSSQTQTIYPYCWKIDANGNNIIMWAVTADQFSSYNNMNYDFGSAYWRGSDIGGAIYLGTSVVNNWSDGNVLYTKGDTEIVAGSGLYPIKRSYPTYDTTVYEPKVGDYPNDLYKWVLDTNTGYSTIIMNGVELFQVYYDTDNYVYNGKTYYRSYNYSTVSNLKYYSLYTSRTVDLYSPINPKTGGGGGGGISDLSGSDGSTPIGSTGGSGGSGFGNIIYISGNNAGGNGGNGGAVGSSGNNGNSIVIVDGYSGSYRIGSGAGGGGAGLSGKGGDGGNGGIGSGGGGGGFGATSGGIGGSGGNGAIYIVSDATITSPDTIQDRPIVRFWNGFAWKYATVNIWDGSSWVAANPKFFNGTSFVKNKNPG